MICSGTARQRSKLAIHVTTIVAGTKKIFLVPLEAAGCDMPHFGANLACGTSSALTTSGSAVALALGTRASRSRWRALRTRARCSFSLARPMSLRRQLVRGSAAAGRARRVVGGVDVSAELGASRLDALLGIQKLRVDITDRKSVV